MGRVFGRTQLVLRLTRDSPGGKLGFEVDSWQRIVGQQGCNIGRGNLAAVQVIWVMANHHITSMLVVILITRSVVSS